jgi:hypothetical protein
MSIGTWTEVDRLEDPDSDFAEEAVQSASFVLWALTGRQFGGVRTVTETYCQANQPAYSPSSASTSGQSSYYPEIRSGGIINACGGGCAGGCEHTLNLRGTPIVNVTEVLIGGSAVPLTSVSIVDRARIAPQSGCWGTCSDVTVTYQYGSYPPFAGIAAATELANQFLWAKAEDDRCQLPAHVTSVSRQGVSWTLIDPQDFFQNGRTGVYSVDLFITATNPHRAQKRPRVFSPDLPSGRTRRSAAVRALPPRLPPAP